MESPHEHIINAPENYMASREEIEEANIGFERLAQRLNQLWQKERLTKEEEKEVELILNNAAVIDELLKRQNS